MLTRMSEAVESRKQRVRAAVRARRRSLSDEARAAARDGLTRRLIELCEERDPRSLTCYVAVPGEPDTSRFLTWAEERGVELFLPATRPGGAMDWIRPSGVFAEGSLGIPEPVGPPAAPAEVAGADLMLIPACAVDRRGVRLGWGGGYFDRFLERIHPRPPVYAVVFDDDLLPALPREPHDEPVDGVVTPSVVRSFGTR